MDQWRDGLSWGLIVVNAGLCGWLAAIAVRTRRLNKTLDRDLDRMLVLDGLLAGIAMRSFGDAHVPFWQAWAGSMGLMRIEVAVGVKRWKWDVDPAKGTPINVLVSEHHPE